MPGVPFNEQRFPELIRQLYSAINELEAMCERPFTLDGHIVGSMAECFAAYYYGIDLYPCSNRGCDAYKGNCKIEIKATQGKRIALRSSPEHLLVFVIDQRGNFTEIYNGPGDQVWKVVEGKKLPSNGQHQVSVTRLKELMRTVPDRNRLPRIR